MRAMQRPAGYPQQKTQEPAAGSTRHQRPEALARGRMGGPWQTFADERKPSRVKETLAVPPGCAMAQSIFVTALPETWRGSRLT